MSLISNTPTHHCEFKVYEEGRKRNDIATVDEFDVYDREF